MACLTLRTSPSTVSRVTRASMCLHIISCATCPCTGSWIRWCKTILLRVAVNPFIKNNLFYLKTENHLLVSNKLWNEIKGKRKLFQRWWTSSGHFPLFLLVHCNGSWRLGKWNDWVTLTEKGEFKLFILRALCPGGVCHVCCDRTVVYSVSLWPLGSQGPQIWLFPEVNNSQK